MNPPLEINVQGSYNAKALATLRRQRNDQQSGFKLIDLEVEYMISIPQSHPVCFAHDWEPLTRCEL